MKKKSIFFEVQKAIAGHLSELKIDEKFKTHGDSGLKSEGRPPHERSRLFHASSARGKCLRLTSTGLFVYLFNEDILSNHEAPLVSVIRRHISHTPKEKSVILYEAQKANAAIFQVTKD